MHRAICVCVFCLCSQLASAQTPDFPLPSAAKAVLDTFQRPLHPLLGSVAPGGGLGAGVGYATPKSEDWFHDASAMVTVNKSWWIDAETGRQTQRSRLGVFGEARDMRGLDFFGIGPRSRREDRTSFRLRESSVGARGWIRLRPGTRAGGYTEIYSLQLGRGGSSDFPSIEDVFHHDQVPGLNDSPTFARYRGYVEFVHPTKAALGQSFENYQAHQGTYQVAVEAVRDHSLGRYSFCRVETELQQRFAGFKDGQRLTLHGLMAVTNSSAVVPYYLEYTLGGSGGLSAFRPDMVGTDGTTATLRGYQDYRFRDRDMLLIQVEYRIPLHQVFNATVFYDAGQVAGRLPDLVDGLKQGTGFSLSYVRNGTDLVRLDVGYGSGEGMHYFWNFGGPRF